MQHRLPARVIRDPGTATVAARNRDKADDPGQAILPILLRQNAKREP